MAKSKRVVQATNKKNKKNTLKRAKWRFENDRVLANLKNEK